MHDKFDYAVLGGGIVGVATALRLSQRFPGAKIVVLEKEAALAQHQSGHNSGVIHAGVYYAPGSLKARLCRDGSKALTTFCQATGIPFENCGKLIVATNDVEVTRLSHLQDRATANGIAFEPIDGAELRRREPYISGREALFIPETSIVDYGLVTRTMAGMVVSSGGTILLNTRVNGIRETPDFVEIKTDDRQILAERLIVCGGAQSDRLAKMAGLPIDFRIVPFRGEYYQLNPRLHTLVNHLIYPVPDPNLPFLGVHLTREMGGGISVGPNAVLGLSREGLPPLSVNVADLADLLTFPGFYKFVAKNFSSGLREMKSSLSKTAYLNECRKQIPSLQSSDMQARKSGVRAQIVLNTGEAVHDFLVLTSARMVHVCNAPSPAATSSLAIADYLIEAYCSPGG